MNFAIVLVDRMVTFMAVTTLVLAVATIVVTLIW
jgi:hypothetical protein